MASKGSILRYIDGVWCFVEEGRSKCLGSADYSKRSDQVCFVRRHVDDNHYVNVQKLDAHQDQDLRIFIKHGDCRRSQVLFNSRG